jgi:hypothetical protein
MHTTVTRKSIETVNATFLSPLLLIYKLVLPRQTESNNELASRIVAVMASQRLKSHNPWGTCIYSASLFTLRAHDELQGLFYCFFLECACKV